eukprot:TRINITY_DN14104_c0_g1_i5.p1 TRINITY_DN14104_c0_g1~~TRINITY_DN14104_c0_g1_i5.p1  ORF type:complete len:359 (+),score=58.41 TRINITY_DN14104_c0_g1_i5:87-1163(+)
MAAAEMKKPLLKTASKTSSLVQFVSDRLPGVCLTAAISMAATFLSARCFGGALPPLLWSAILGISFGNLLGVPGSLKEGVAFSKARLLRLGIILYGFKLSAQQIMGIGVAGLVLDVFVMISTLALGWFIGTKVLGMAVEPTLLITTGASICGCSAVLAAQPVVKAAPHEVTAAIGTVVLCGTVSMFLYPALYGFVPALSAAPHFMGVYTGATVHELAGVVAAGNAMGAEIAATAVVTKLTRVLCLAPFLVGLQRLLGKKKDDDKNVTVTVPWFAVGFVAVAALNSAVTVPAALKAMATSTSVNALSMAMAGLGVETSLGKVLGLGSRPVILAVVLFAHLLVSGYLVACGLSFIGMLEG